MRKIVISGVAALLCAAALPAAAAPAASNQDNSTNNAQAESSGPQSRDGSSRRVCVRSAPLSNSRISRPVCRTQAEWDRMRRNGELDND